MCRTWSLSTLLFFLFSLVVPNTWAMGTTRYLRADTTLHSDGSVDREISQPLKFTPDAAWEAGWEKVWLEHDSKSFAARGHFNSVDSIPDYFRKYPSSLEKYSPDELPDDALAAALVRDFSRNDYVLVTEHKFGEKLTDTVQFDKARRGFDELFRFFSHAYQNVVREALCPEYDASPYIKWLQRDYLRIGNEEVVSSYLFLAKGFRFLLGESSGGRIDQWIGEIHRAHGLHVSDDEVEMLLEFVEPGQSSLKLPYFGHFIRGPTGEFLTENEREEIWCVPPDEILKRLVVDEYGNEAAFEKRSATLSAHLFGAHFGLDSTTFQYSLVMPGVIVETSGTITAENRVFWAVNSLQAYPFGFDMTARSLEPDLELQRQLIGETMFKTRATMLEFVKVVANESSLNKILKRSRNKGRLLPEDFLQFGRQFVKRKSPRTWFWFCKAAGANLSAAAVNLGLWHQPGTHRTGQPADFLAGIAEDERAAYVWYALARRVDSRGGFALEEITKNLTSDQLQEAQAMLEAWTPDKCPWPG